jgi:DAACS family dicarboxylate/amino acid:cation (Na+ or H+) symporter
MPAATASVTPAMPLHTRILLGLLLGGIAGIAANLAFAGDPTLEWIVRSIASPAGSVWLSALIMVVIPLIVSTVSLGVAGLGSITRLGRIGALALGSFLALSTIAAAVGLTLVHLIRPGAGLDPDLRTALMETYAGQSGPAMGLATTGFGIETFVRMVPRNPIQAAANGEMLAVIVFALFLGAALTRLPEEKARPLLAVLDSLAHVTIAIIEMVMRLAPYAVACLIFSVTASFGLGLLASLAKYVVTVIGGLAVFMAVVYPLVLALVAGQSPAAFFRHARVVILTAFSTSSSNATLPTTLRVTEQELKVPNEIAGFVVPLGATMNMNGTALFEGVTVLFVAQVFGVQLAIGQQLLVVVMSVITAIGTAGVPGGSIPLLMMVLGMVGVPMEGIAIVLGVDRLLDMCRTTVNVAGDMVTATVVQRFSGVRRGTIL